MSEADWPQEFTEMLREAMPQLPLETVLAPDTSLRHAGLSSLGVVTIITAVEDEFDVDLTSELADPDLFGTAGSLWSRVRALRAERTEVSLRAGQDERQSHG